MVRGILLAFLCYPFLEVCALVFFAQAFGGTALMVWLIVSFLVGLFMLRNREAGALLGLLASVKSSNRPSIYNLLWPVRYLLSGVLFVIPGVINTIAAILLLLPFKGPQSMRKSGSYHQGPTTNQPDIIEGEFSEVKDDSLPKDRRID